MALFVDFGKFQQSHLIKAIDGIRLFNDQLYWECHEELEDHWLEDASDNARYVYWAIIQVATSLYHYRQDNLVGAQGMLRKAKDKLMKCENLNVETQVLFDLLNWKEFKTIVRDISDNDKLENYENLVDFRFIITVSD